MLLKASGRRRGEVELRVDDETASEELSGGASRRHLARKNGCITALSTRKREWNTEKEQRVLVPSSNSSSMDETVRDGTGLPTSERESERDGSLEIQERRER
jgi:hypothetical protein